MEHLFSDLPQFIKTVGYIGLFFITFAESGLFIGFFLPGDSLLFTAGFLASQGFLYIGLVMVVALLGAVVGDGVGYAFGKRVGPKIFSREDSVFFHKDHIKRAEVFYETHGKKTIIIARFMPIVRTFAPIVAGVGRMPYATFLLFNVIGGALWAIGLSWLGYFLGNSVPNIDHYLLPIIVGIIVLSAAPTVVHVLRDPEMRRAIYQSLRRVYNRMYVKKTDSTG